MLIASDSPIFYLYGVRFVYKCTLFVRRRRLACKWQCLSLELRNGGDGGELVSQTNDSMHNSHVDSSAETNKQTYYEIQKLKQTNINTRRML